MESITVAGQPLTPELLGFLAFLLVCAIVGGRYYTRVIGNVRRTGGWVGISDIVPADIIGAGLLANWFLLLAMTQFFLAGKEVEPAAYAPVPMALQLLAMYVLIITLLAVSFFLRGAKIEGVLGLDKRPQLKRTGQGLLLLLAVLPIMGLSSVLWNALLTNGFGMAPPEQDPVKMMRGVSAPLDRLAVILMAVFIAPVGEEIIFRGYLLPVAKRYVGRWSAIIGTGVFFGLIHGNLGAVIPLTVLGIALALAYEYTGSILTPIIMHMASNGIVTAILMFSPLPPETVPPTSPPSPMPVPEVQGILPSYPAAGWCLGT